MAQIDMNERERLAVLGEYGIDAVLAEPDFDRLTKLAANVFHAPIALVSLIESERQLFASRVGIEVCETALDVSFCAHAIQRDDIMVVLDATRDPRFRDNPLVTNAPHIRFYAGAPLHAPSGHPLGALCIIDSRPREVFSEADRRNLTDLAALVLDRLELRRLALAERASQIRFKSIAATSPDAIICIDDKGLVTFWNAAAEKLLGYAAAEMVGAAVAQVVPPATMKSVLGGIVAGVSSCSRRTMETDMRRRDGSLVPVELSMSMWVEEGRSSFGAIVRDIAEFRSNEDRLFRLAHLDPLTELPNRTLLRIRLKQALESQEAACVMLVGLDGFKDINDSLGYSGGDAVLLQVARRLKASVRPTDMVARMDGDEFAILIPGLDDAVRAAEIADLTIQNVTEMLFIDEQPVYLSASVGITTFPPNGADAEDVLSCAYLALDQAKTEGRRCRRFFTPALRSTAQTRRACQVELRRAFDQQELELFYQPQVRLADGALVGAEALLRWRHPERGLLSPAAFIPTLEAGLLAAPVGDWTLGSACRQAAAWRALGVSKFRVGINLFGAQFRTGDLADKVRAALATADLPASALELEITENILLRHDEEMIGPLRELRALGVGIALDDYGTGYASLGVLKRFPLTRLKVDQSFVRGMCEAQTDAAIVRATLYLARSFGLGVIAEGVETEEQWAHLKRNGCEEAQGFLFGRPMPASEFTRRLDSWATEPGPALKQVG